jgi:GTP cyclohydrolase I
MSAVKQAVDTQRAMPDVASDAQVDIAGQLQWVGMGAIEMPVLIEAANGSRSLTPAHVDAFVDLPRADARGIHMSRLYLALDKALAEEPLTPSLVRQLLVQFLESHEGLSEAARLEISFDYMVRRPALASANSGWKRYPVKIAAEMRGNELKIDLGCTVVYSSTCPCSAALARQLIQERFLEDFSGRTQVDADEIHAWLGTEQGICATPHSQRSEAEVEVRLASAFGDFRIIELVDAVENALKTPVQTAVKRIDEQAFARLNGENLMFCEDAGRRVQAALNELEDVVDFRAKCSHYESLHPHDAVSFVTKGVPGGMGS